MCSSLHALMYIAKIDRYMYWNVGNTFSRDGAREDVKASGMWAYAYKH